MSVGDVNSVDHTCSVDPSTGDLHGSDPALAAQFQAHLRLARQNVTAGPRYAFNNTQPNQTATDVSPRFNFQQPGPQTNKSPLPTNTLGRWTVTPGAGGLLGLFGSELGLVGAAFQQLGHMQHMIEIAPVLTLDGKRFGRDAVKNEIMNQLTDADRERLGLPPLTAGGNVSDAERQQPVGTNQTGKPGNRKQLEGIEIRSREEQEFVNGLSPHLTREQVQAELEGFRRRNGTADGAGGSKPPTNDRPPATPETTRPLGPGEMLSRHLSEDYGLLAELDRDGMLKIAIVADKKNKPPTTPKGGEMFEEAMRAFGPNVKGIRGNWIGTGTMTENFDSFKAALKSGLSPEDAALNHTFTGHMAAKWGFTRATVVLNDAAKVIVEFRR
jgi:hypothetical protein